MRNPPLNFPVSNLHQLNSIPEIHIILYQTVQTKLNNQRMMIENLKTQRNAAVSNRCALPLNEVSTFLLNSCLPFNFFFFYKFWSTFKNGDSSSTDRSVLQRAAKGVSRMV